MRCMSLPMERSGFRTANGLYRYEEESFLHYTKADGLPKDILWYSATTRDGLVWSGGNGNSLVRLELDHTNHWRNPFAKASNECLELVSILDIQADTKVGLWVGGYRLGRSLYYRPTQAGPGADNRFRRLLEFENNPGEIRAMHVDLQNTLWVGTRQGLYRVNAQATGEGNVEVKRVEVVTN